MEKFKSQIKSRIIGYIIVAILFTILFITFMILDMTGVLDNIIPDIESGALAGFRSGFCTSIIGFAVVKAIISAAALKDENKLKSMYIKETDERTQMIVQKTASASFCVTIIALGAATIVASFISMDILKVLIAIIFFIVFVRMGFQFYYARKY